METDVTDREVQSSEYPDADLLRAYVSDRSEQAFQALVEKYLGMTLGIARRRCGRPDLAEEIAQNVFAILARKADGLKATPTLAGWIYRVTMVECAATLRRERKRADKMKEYADHARIAADGEEFWSAAQPHLDEAIDELPPNDRDLLLMRFWEKKSFREIAGSLGKSEAASQKQGERALEKLSGKLRRRGIAVSVGALTAGFATQFAAAAPPALVTTVTQGALTAAPALSTGTLILKSIEAMTYAKTKTALAVAVVAAFPIGMQWNANSALQNRLDEMEAKLATAPAPGVGEARTVESQPQTTITAPPLQRSNTPASTSPRRIDPVAQLRNALNQTDPLKRSLAVSSLLANLDPADAPGIAAVFDAAHQSGARYTKEHEMFMRTWGRIDGPAALQHAIDSTGDTSGSVPALAALAGWATADPDAARDWIEGLEEGQDKEDLIVGLLDGWAVIDHTAASRYIESRPRTPARNRVRKMLLERALMTGGIPAARDWFNSILGEGNNKPYKQLAFDELNQRMLAHDPKAAAEWIKEQDGQDFLRGRAIRNTAREIAKASPSEAINLVSSMQHMRNGQLIGSYSDIINEWAQVDPGAAGSWLNENPDHGQHDVMVNRYITTIADIEPETALQWAGTIDNGNRRRSSQMIAAAALLKEQGDAAIPTLEAAGLTPAMIKSAPNHAELMKQLSGQERFAEQNLIIGESTVTIGAPRSAQPRENR